MWYGTLGYAQRVSRLKRLGDLNYDACVADSVIGLILSWLVTATARHTYNKCERNVTFDDTP